MHYLTPSISNDLIRTCAPVVSPIQTSAGEFLPLDMDVSPFDNSKTQKEGVSRTDKGVDGFAPIFACLGTEGYLVNLEFIEGKQLCQKNTPQFINATLDYARQITDQPILTRLDSGNDSQDNFPDDSRKNVHFIIKRNLRREMVPFIWSAESIFPNDGKGIPSAEITTCCEVAKFSKSAQGTSIGLVIGCSHNLGKKNIWSKITGNGEDFFRSSLGCEAINRPESNSTICATDSGFQQKALTFFPITVGLRVHWATVVTDRFDVITEGIVTGGMGVVFLHRICPARYRAGDPL
ncbi:MAG: hypothetical protein CR984_04260 [Proteobacteria bacterium]|nr:MAG: hypothetical protein CR984_04260 [Pseudomonadota bacterium]